MKTMSLMFYSAPGLEADTFQSWMQSSGYPVYAANDRDSAIRIIEAHPHAVSIVALDQRPRELLALARDLVKHSHHHSHIFILTGPVGFEAGMDSVEVIARPFRLSEVVRRIDQIRRAQFVHG